MISITLLIIFSGFFFHVAGVHRQVLYATVGWCVGYYISKRADYIHAKLDRDLMEYIRQHPEDFKEKGILSCCFKKDIAN